MADLLRVMEREMLCSEHAASCFLEAKRRDKARKKAKRSSAGAIAGVTPDVMDATAGSEQARPA